MEDGHWVAGFLERSKVNVKYRKTKNGSRLLKLTIGHYVKANLVRLQKALGCGKVYGPYKLPTDHKLYILNVDRYREIIRAVERLEPFLARYKYTEAMREIKLFQAHELRKPGKPVT
jgi:hypothetical protein